MVEKTSVSKLLILIFVFSLTYRLLLLTHYNFPPGSDIGLHESMVNSIAFEKTDFFWNPYHMGGEPTATNPGYHIFVAFIRAFTGIPDYLSHVLVASFFSALGVFCAFLVTKRFWSSSASMVAAFLVVFSAGDIEMLCWGGYPNLITLLLISIVFYFYLQPKKFSYYSYFPAVSLLVSAIYLTHIFSAFVFSAIVFLVLILCSIFHKQVGLARNYVVFWLVPLIIGILIVSPYLVKIFPVYFGSSGAIINAPLETREALFWTRRVPVEYLVIAFSAVLLFFALSKRYTGKYLTISAILFAAWIITPAIFTQSYLFGLYLDYRRFVYFFVFPVIICLSLVVEVLYHKLLHFKDIMRNKSSRKSDICGRDAPESIGSRSLLSKSGHILLITFLLMVSILFASFLTAPNAGFEKASFYQFMTEQKFDAIQWIKANTPADAVLVANAEYGWWISGFAKRPTLSAVDPQYLILTHELEPAAAARNLLRSKYFIDNEILRVEYGAKRSEGNFEFFTKLGGLPSLYQFFTLRDKNIDLLYRNSNVSLHLDVAELYITSKEVTNGSGWAAIKIIRENQEFIFRESITIYSGIRFLKISLEVQNKNSEVVLDWLSVPFLSNGVMVRYDSGVAFVDQSAHALNQLLFVEEKMGEKIRLYENTDSYVIVKNLEGQSKANMDFFIGSSLLLDDKNQDYIYSVIRINSKICFDNIGNTRITLFDYRDILKIWDISYVVLTSNEHAEHLINDACFDIVYKNSEVIILVNRRR
ncbi:MAG: hypothetical protein ACPLKZ_02130 [Candidatus Bathyarchaeales archaeon]